jgi:hypothetical protein
MSGRASVASRTAFQNLAIDSGEESEVEVEVEESSEPMCVIDLLHVFQVRVEV